MPSRNESGRSDPPQRRAGARITIREVAELAKVSLGTVSNVMNNPSIVAPSTRERVLRAIETAGFVPSTPARQLRDGTSRTVGVVILDIANPFFTEMVRGAEDVLREDGYVLLLCSSDESPPREQHYLGVLEEHRVAGVLITPAVSSLERIAALAARGTPTVLLDSGGSRHTMCSVTVDDVRGGELAASHLFDTGHARIVFLNGPLSIRQCAGRRRGARRAARLAGRDADDAVVELRVGVLTDEQGEAAVAAILAVSPRPTAVMCANDLLALGVLRGLAARSVSVPGEMAVVGYDDVSFASMLSPALTSVRQPKVELGAAAAKLLLEEIRDPSHQHRDVRYEPELVVRASSSRPARAAAAARGRRHGPEPACATRRSAPQH